MAEIKIPRFKYKPPTEEDCFRQLSEMSYKSPIETISQGFRVQMEDNIMKAIRSYGINVDRDELVKALQYDRNQYEEGFIAGSKLNTDAIKREIAREIFEEIEKVVNYALCVDITDWSAYAELKKKYTEGE